MRTLARPHLATAKVRGHSGAAPRTTSMSPQVPLGTASAPKRSATLRPRLFGIPEKAYQSSDRASRPKPCPTGGVGPRGQGVAGTVATESGSGAAGLYPVPFSDQWIRLLIRCGQLPSRDRELCEIEGLAAFTVDPALLPGPKDPTAGCARPNAFPHFWRIGRGRWCMLGWRVVRVVRGSTRAWTWCRA